MRQPAAKMNDTVIATDIHYVITPSPSTVPLPHSFNGILNAELSKNVNVMKLPAAIVGSVAQNTPPHVPTPPGTSFSTPPANQGTVIRGSATVLVNGKGLARNSDKADTCNDVPNPGAGTIVATGNVMVGD